MTARKSLLLIMGLALIAVLALACGPAPTAAPPVVVTAPPILQTVVVAGTPQTIVVTATPPPTKAVTPTAKAVNIAATWGGGEREAFLAVVDAFIAKTGIPVNYESVRNNLGTIVRTRVAGGNPPDIVFEPRPGEVAEFARAGNLVKLDTIVNKDDLAKNFGKAFTDLGTVDGSFYGLLFKANSKSTMWYKPASFTALGVKTPEKWEDLIAIADKYKAAGKVPFATGGKDAWTLTDWFENLYARNATVAQYNDLFIRHKVAWTDPTVKKAMAQYVQIMTTAGYQAGGSQGVLGTGFVDSIGQVFGKKPVAEMYYEGGFVGVIATTDVNKDLKPGDDLNFFTFPVSDAQYGAPIVGGGDLAVVFKDSPETRAFMNFLVSADAANAFAKTNSISPNKSVDGKNFTSVLASNEYKQVAGASAFVFDGSDMMPSAMNDFFFSKLQDLIQNPKDVDRIAGELEKFASTAY